MSVTVEGVLGPGGALSGALERYEHRPEQLHMALEVERAFDRREVLLAEAGTGTGKTLAYLVPAVLSGRRVVISTATKNLQEQVFFKDMPLLKDRVGVQFEAALLKGRSNYLCLQRFEQFDHSPQFVSREEGKLYPALRAWALKTETGDRAELELPDHFATWGELSTTSETCLGPKCPLYEPCFVTRARRRAEDADVLVVNHHLFFADLVLKGRGRQSDGVGVIPRYEAVVFDEAHALEDIATEYFGVSVSNFRFEDLVRDALSALPPTSDRGGMISAIGLQLRGRSEAWFKAISMRMGRGESVRLEAGALAHAGGLQADLQTSLAAMASFCSNADEPEVTTLSRRAGDLAAEFDFIAAADSLEHVFWAEPHPRGLFLRAAPIDVAKELQLRLYSAVDTVVFTSATLTADNTFDFFARRMGLRGGDGDGVAEHTHVREVRVDSPFDYPRQAALYVPTHLPEPNVPGFIEAASEELYQLADVTSGRAFFLFTSLRNMTAAHALLKNRLPYQVLLQGERPKSVLLAEFQREPSVLFASHSFWEGVDVPGEALSLVVIDKLPFASPTEPVVAARIRRLEESGQDAFNGYQLPEAAISLRQGFGRLIRTKDDRGIVAILDRRLSTRAYGRVLLRSLPAAQRLQTVEHLRDWFA